MSRAMPTARACALRAEPAAQSQAEPLVAIAKVVHFSSATDLWATPQDFFARLDALHAFDLDVCATADNAKCDRFFTAADDGLAQDWSGTCWMNPPYGRSIGRWMRKAYESSLTGATVVCLVPARTDTRWWHDYAMKGSIQFIRGRLKFNGAKDAPFPSAIVVFPAQGIEAGTAETGTGSVHESPVAESDAP